MKVLLIFPLLFFFIAGCENRTSDSRDQVVDETHVREEGWQQEQEEVNFTKAVAVLQPAQGNKVSGTITFSRENNGIKVVADIKGLKSGMHGFHIHEFGDCSAPDFTSAGDHFNPAQRKHGAPTDAERHHGDLGNIEADGSGNAHIEWTDSLLSFRGMNSILGRAVVVHEKQDDLTSQPSGDAGRRIACGVIGIANQ